MSPTGYSVIGNVPEKLPDDAILPFHRDPEKRSNKRKVRDADRAVLVPLMPGPHWTNRRVPSRLRLSIMINGYLLKQATLYF